MTTSLALLFMLGAAALEAAGDAIVRAGMFSTASTGRRALTLAVGGVVLFAYACGVNAPRWDFGRLIGVYALFFFLAAQLINWIGFHHRPTLPILVGGLFFLAGAALMAFWRA